MSRDYSSHSTLLHLTLLSLLYTTTESASAAYFVRIANIYHGVYLDEQLSPATSPSFWVMDSNVIYTSDKTKSLCLNGNQVKLCSGPVTTEWSYDVGTMALYTVSGGLKSYLTLGGSGVGSTLLQDDNEARILLFPPTGDSDKPLVNKLNESMKKLKVDLGSIKEKYNALLALKESIVRRNADLASHTKTAEEKYNSQVGKISDDLARYNNLVEETESTKKAQIATINGTQQTLTNNILPSIYDEMSTLHAKPSEFLEKLKQEDLQQLLERDLAEVNKTLEGYLFRHRLAPVSTYDWLVILATVLYVVYFVDIVGRAAGWNCCVSRRVRRIGLEMEAPSNIQPEYYLQDDESATSFARTRESIKGKLKLKPVD